MAGCPGHGGIFHARCEMVRVVGHEYHSRADVAQQPLYAVRHKVHAHVRVDCAQDVVEEVHVGAHVARASEGNARLLPAAQIDPALADLGHVARRQLL